MIKYILIFLVLFSLPAAAQSPEMADGLRADGKIYVVVAVIAIVFAALAIFLALIDRKIGKLEKKVNGKA
jgi:hypothetical protein